MSEFENAWATDEDFWEFVGDNRKLVGIAISNGQGLDILNALKDIYTTIEKEPESAMRMLTLLGTVIYASSIGEGKQFTDEIQVVSAMEQFDSSMKEMLDEESK
jgi:hypothetical protein